MQVNFDAVKTAMIIQFYGTLRHGIDMSACYHVTLRPSSRPSVYCRTYTVSSTQLNSTHLWLNRSDQYPVL